ncbi:MAG: flagellin, partial [Patescibacteria group bacterium]
MGLRIQNNIAAMNAHKQLSSADAGMTKSLERLSSGYRINKAADDAAGLSISQQFRADIASFKVASRNTAEAGSLLQVAEGAMDQIGNMLTRLKELATQAASANAGSNLDKIESEKAKLVSEIDRIANSTEYAGSKLLDGSFGTAAASWDEIGADDTLALDTVNGNRYYHTDLGSNTSTISFTFSSSIAKLAEQHYTLSTLATGGAFAGTVGEVKITGDSLGDVYAGYYDADTNSLKFDTIGLTIDGASSALTAATVDGDTFNIVDVGYDDMTVSNSTSTGTWTIIDNVSGFKLTNSRTGESQTISGTASGPKTLDFDQLGIKLTLNSNYDSMEFGALHIFTVTNSGSSTFQVGAYNTANDQIAISVGDVTTGTTGLNLAAIDLSTSAGAQDALTTINTAIDTLAGRRGEIGAAQNRLGYAAANLATTIENVQAAESVIRDVDMAQEMTAFTKNQILMQASTSMLAQANMA